MNAGHGSVRPLLAAGALVALLAATVLADYQESFRQGILQYRAQNWNGTVAMMRAALQERANEEGRVRITGNESVPYLPSYYLGDALMRMGDCQGAMTAFDRARQTAAASNRSWLSRMDEARETCAATLAASRNAEAAKAIQAAASAVNDARAAKQRIDGYKDREFGAEAMHALNSEIAAASGSLANAELRLGQARQANDPQAAREVERQARAAGKDLSSLETRLQDQVRRLADAAAAARTSTPAAPAAPAKEPTGPAKPTPTPPPDPAAAQRLQAAVRTAGAALRSAQQAAAAYDAASGGAQSGAVQQARSELNAVAEVVARGTRATESELNAAAGSADRVRDVFTRERDAALSRDLAEAAQAVDRLLTSAAESLDTLDKLARPAAGRRAALDPKLLSAHYEEHRRLRAALSGPPARNPDSLRRMLGSATELDQTLSALVTTYGQRAAAAGGVPPDLLEGARSYFAGRYAEAAAQLGSVQLSEAAPAQVRLQMHLLRAAAAFSAWALGGERDDALRQTALNEIAACRRIDPSFTPDPAVFSPRFVRLFQGT